MHAVSFPIKLHYILIALAVLTGLTIIIQIYRLYIEIRGGKTRVNLIFHNFVQNIGSIL